MADHRPKNADFWHRPNQAMSLGCFPCPDRSTCGGIAIDAPVTSCIDFCECKSGDNCPFVCPFKPREYVARVREVCGFELNVPPGNVVACPDLPLMAPVLPNGYSRSTTLNFPAVGLPLHRLFGAKSGTPIHADRKSIARHFGFADNARIVVSGVGYDRHLEHYWSNARGAEFPEFLAAIGADLVTTPNFSLFSDVPRTEDQYNMKRIAICWQELSALNIPAVIHVNARTNHDWKRWAHFLRDHPEALGVAFEFKTGGASPTRGAWHRDRLLELAQSVGRRMLLVLRGGLPYIGALARSFTMVYLSHTPVIKALRRYRMHWTAGSNESWPRHFVKNGADLDELVQHNVSTYAAMVQFQSRTRADHN